MDWGIKFLYIIIYIIYVRIPKYTNINTNINSQSSELPMLYRIGIKKRNEKDFCKLLSKLAYHLYMYSLFYFIRYMY